MGPAVVFDGRGSAERGRGWLEELNGPKGTQKSRQNLTVESGGPIQSAAEKKGGHSWPSGRTIPATPNVNTYLELLELLIANASVIKAACEPVKMIAETATDLLLACAAVFTFRLARAKYRAFLTDRTV